LRNYERWGVVSAPQLFLIFEKRLSRGQNALNLLYLNYRLFLNFFQDMIFKAYDIRGIYPSQIDEKVVYLIGRAFVKFLAKPKANKFLVEPKINIAVGRDNRISSPLLFKALVKGLTEQGANVIDIGLSTTPMLYFSVAYYKFDGGIEITASHNPFHYNGLKLVKERAIPLSEKSGLNEIKKIIQKRDFPKKNKGKIFHKKILKDYINFNTKSTKITEIKPFKIVIDTANAVPGIVIPGIFKKIPGKIYHLFGKLDGNFPNHEPNPLIEKNLKALKAKVKKIKADLGIAFDGDGDRIIFVDNFGKFILPDLIGALITSIILKGNPNQKVLYDIRSTKALPEIIKLYKGIPIMGRVGHSFIKEKMRKEDILFAIEFSGHYYHKFHYFCESPILVMLEILKELSKAKISISELILPFKKYFHSGEINFKVKNKKKILKKIEEKYKKGKISHLDGLRVDFKNWWFSLRPSQTENILRLVIEAKKKELAIKKKKELTALIIGAKS